MNTTGHGSEHSSVLGVEGLGKSFQLYANPGERLRHALTLATGQRPAESVKWALRDVTFSVRKGEAYGIIGSNGSGKSTLLKIICGVMQPSTGSSIVRGRVLGLLELGAGLDPELTGRRNVVASTSLLGFPAGYAQERMAEIEAFADLGEFFDLPVKLYSSGMLVRLAFSLYLFLEPDVLVIDEALSVGDHFFQRKCAAAMARFKARGATMLFVSHNLGTLKAMCDRALLLADGRVAMEGDVGEVIAAYLHPGARRRPQPEPARLAEPACALEAIAPATEARRILDEVEPVAPIPLVPGWRAAGVRFVNQTGGPAALYEMGEPARLEVVLAAPAGTLLPSVTVEILDRFDRVLTGRQVAITQATRLPYGSGEAIVVVVDLRLNLFIGDYVAQVAVANDQPDRAIRSQPFSVYNRRTFPSFYGIAGLPADFRLEARAKRSSAKRMAQAGPGEAFGENGASRFAAAARAEELNQGER